MEDLGKSLSGRRRDVDRSPILMLSALISVRRAS
jgi:hypothetical protein